MYSTAARAVVAADRAAVFAALVDPVAVAHWRVPDGMSAEVHELDPRPGGRIRMSLTYEDPTTVGKTAGSTDTYAGTFVEVVEGERVVEEVAFETDDPALDGTITMTTTLRGVDGGTEVEIRMDGLPDAVPRHQNEAGTRMALEKLVRLVG